MEPSKAQYFYAQPWLIKSWLAAVPLLFIAGAILSTGITLESIKDWSVFLSVAAIVPLAGLLGYFVAILVGWFIFGPLYYDRGIKNGAPFVAGEHVRILVGPHRDRIVRVYDVWEIRDQVRVDLSEQERIALTDVFSYFQVCREDSRGRCAVNPPEAGSERTETGTECVDLRDKSRNDEKQILPG